MESIDPVMDLGIILKLQNDVKRVEIEPNILEYTVNLVSSTRLRSGVKLGASPRVSIALMKATSAWALLEGRDYVIPDDVAGLVPWILKHRIIYEAKALISGNTPRVSN